mmetsp:Transcript_111263/g.310857  ORF Transcript_111263/g.310857 Transcript_111263/m.310857 type:complete len:203 (+) Transcript_111263:200-808(+)
MNVFFTFHVNSQSSPDSSSLSRAWSNECPGRLASSRPTPRGSWWSSSFSASTPGSASLTGARSGAPQQSGEAIAPAPICACKSCTCARSRADSCRASRSCQAMTSRSISHCCRCSSTPGGAAWRQSSSRGASGNTGGNGGGGGSSGWGIAGGGAGGGAVSGALAASSATSSGRTCVKKCAYLHAASKAHEPVLTNCAHNFVL